MNENELERHAQECIGRMKARQEAFEKQYDLGQYPTYWGDEGSIVLASRSESPARREFEVVFIGRHTLDDRLAWAWADDSLAGNTRERSARIKELSAVTGFPQFETPVIDAGPAVLEKVLAVVLDHLDAAACFADKSREPMLLVAIVGTGTEPKVEGAATTPGRPSAWTTWSPAAKKKRGARSRCRYTPRPRAAGYCWWAEGQAEGRALCLPPGIWGPTTG